MTKTKWKNKIRKSVEEAGVYKPFFEDTIDTLAAILARRDEIEQEYIDTGACPVIMHTNKGGNANPTKNPLLAFWDKLNLSALNYFAQLGLTPKGLKQIDEQLLKTREKTSFEKLMEELSE